jgi:hypothetical protein
MLLLPYHEISRYLRRAMYRFLALVGRVLTVQLFSPKFL